MRRSGRRGGRCNRWLQGTAGGSVSLFPVVFYNEYRNFNVSPSNGDSNPRRGRDL